MNRRNFLIGLAAGLAPAIIRTPGLLMPIRAILIPHDFTTENVVVRSKEWWAFTVKGWVSSSSPEASEIDIADRKYRWLGLRPDLVSASSEPCEEDT